MRWHHAFLCHAAVMPRIPVVLTAPIVATLQGPTGQRFQWGPRHSSQP